VIPIDAPSSIGSGAVGTFKVQGTFSGPFTWSVLNGEIVGGQGTDTLQVRAGNSGNVVVRLDCSGSHRACRRRERELSGQLLLECCRRCNLV
jgi:hypothetical protein